MKKILAFGASNSKKSINQQLAKFCAENVEDATVNLIDLNDFEMPIYSIDRENENGIPDKAKKFGNLISESDGVIISLAEHNGSYTAAFKNLLDWTSRIYGGKLWQNKSLFVLSTSPGGRGGATVLNAAVSGWPHLGGVISAQFSLPFFTKNFSSENGIIESDLKMLFDNQLLKFEEALNA